MKNSLKFAFILGFLGFVTSFGAHIVAVNLPFYAKDLGIGLTMIGLLIAIYDFAEIIAKPVFGGQADKKGMKRALYMGIIIFTLASLLYPFVPPKLLIVVRFLQGLGGAGLSAVSLAMVGILYKDNKGKAFGIYNAIKGLGYVASPLIGGAIVMKSNFAGIFYACAAIGLLGLLLITTLPADKQKSVSAFDDDDDNFSLKSLKDVFQNKALLPWFFVIVVNMFFVGILFGFLPVRIYELGYNPFQTGVLLSITTVSYLLVQPIAGTLADKFSPVYILRIGMLMSCISIAIIPFVSGIPLLIVCLISGLGIGVVWTNSDAMVSKLSEENKMGATMGLAGSFKELGDMIGPLLMGVISQAFGLQWGFVICAIIGFLALLITIFVGQKTQSN